MRLYMCRPPETTVSRVNHNFTNPAQGKDRSENAR